MTRMRSIVITAGVGLVITLSACGNGPPEVAAGGGGPVVGVAGANLGQPGTKVTANSSNQFAPGTLTASTGEVIQWTVAADSVPHNVTFDSNGTLSSPSTVGPGESWQVKFTVPGTYAYHCTIHDGMTGQVTVSGSAAPAGTTAASPSAAGSASPTPSP
jgi:plastocyanin